MSPAARAQFDRLPRTVRTRVTHVFERLEQWPQVSGAKPLRGRLAGQLRIRTGDYRVVFEVREHSIRIEQIEHRKDVYED